MKTKILFSALAIALIISVKAQPQELDSCLIATYNILNYPGTDTTSRNPYFRTIISSMNPDVLIVQEMSSQEGVDGFLDDIMNSYGETFAAGIFIDTGAKNNAIFYKTAKFNFINTTRIITEERDINEFILLHNGDDDTLRIYSVHLKAGDTPAEREQRAREVDSLRKVTDKLHLGAYYIVLGDFNIYNSSELAYQKLLDQNNTGYVLDPINRPGDWHEDSLFADIHTQSTRTRQFGGGVHGGLDDRFDIILVSQTIEDVEWIRYISETYTSYGNDGNHFNDSINAPPNTAVTQEIANASHYASDHLPVYAKFLFDYMVPVETEIKTPTEFILYQNYPNPFNPNTKIKYQIPELTFITLRIYDVLGNEITTLVNEEKPAGNYEVEFNAASLPSTIYFYRLTAGNFIETKKMSLIK